MRIVAILATYNEERYIASCLEDLFDQGVDVYLIDNCSTDRTICIAEQYVGSGLIDIESLPREDMFSLRPQLRRKEEIASSLEANWFIHLDTDEIRRAPHSLGTLAQAIEEVDRLGYNAINFVEFTFIPTQEQPDHDHSRFLRTMQSYYAFVPGFTHGLKGWKKQMARVELAWSGGHEVRFPGIRPYPVPFQMRHYPFLSVEHAVRKYGLRRFDAAEVADGWHGWRSCISPERLKLPSRQELHTYTSDEHLDCSGARTTHVLATALAPHTR
jgi:glycosyltransferase involved in cell wall biosynthesis